MCLHPEEARARRTCICNNNVAVPVPYAAALAAAIGGGGGVGTWILYGLTAAARHPAAAAAASQAVSTLAHAVFATMRYQNSKEEQHKSAVH